MESLGLRPEPGDRFRLTAPDRRRGSTHALVTIPTRPHLGSGLAHRAPVLKVVAEVARGTLEA